MKDDELVSLLHDYTWSVVRSVMVENGMRHGRLCGNPANAIARQDALAARVLGQMLGRQPTLDEVKRGSGA